jgi:hypothetical protein
MDAFIIEGTKMTPEIKLDGNNNLFSIKGSSRPENPKQFYTPVFDWLTEYFGKENVKIKFEIQMEYFNTSTSKILLDLLELFEQHNENHEIHVVWYYHEDDEEMKEAGEELLDLVEISHELKML